MPDPTPSPRQPGSESTPGRPRWVNVFAIIVIALILTVVIVHLAGGGMGPHS